MKLKKVSYSIAKPCNENWESMTPENQGKFCDVCSKLVVDFSQMSDEAIVAYLESKPNDKICGRFEVDQLNKSYSLPQKRSFNFDLRAVVLGVALTTIAMDYTYAQGQVVKVEKVPEDTMRMERLLGDVAVFYHHEEPKAFGKITLYGHVKVQDVVIELLDQQQKVIGKITPKLDGSYEVDLDWKLNPYALRFIGENLQEQVVVFSSYSNLNHLDVTLVDRRVLIKGEIQREE